MKTSKGVVEGLPTLQVVYDYIKEKELSMPILEFLLLLKTKKNIFFRVIYGLVNGKLNREDAVEKLMMRGLEAEFAFAEIHHK